MTEFPCWKPPSSGHSDLWTDQGQRCKNRKLKLCKWLIRSNNVRGPLSLVLLVPRPICSGRKSIRFFLLVESICYIFGVIAEICGTIRAWKIQGRWLMLHSHLNLVWLVRKQMAFRECLDYSKLNYMGIQITSAVSDMVYFLSISTQPVGANFHLLIQRMLYFHTNQFIFFWKG